MKVDVQCLWIYVLYFSYSNDSRIKEEIDCIDNVIAEIKDKLTTLSLTFTSSNKFVQVICYWINKFSVLVIILKLFNYL